MTIFHQLDARLESALSFRKAKEATRGHRLVSRIVARSAPSVESSVEWFDFDQDQDLDIDVDVDVDVDVDIDVYVEETEEFEGDTVAIDESTVAVDDNNEDGEATEGLESEENDHQAAEDDNEPVDEAEFEILGLGTSALGLVMEADEASEAILIPLDEPGTDEKFDLSLNELMSEKFTSFVERAVERASLAAGSRLERDDLSQVAQLAALEAGKTIDDVPPGQRPAFLRDQVTTALKRELKSVASDSRSLTSVPDIFAGEDEVEELISVERYTKVDGEVADDAVARTEATTEVRGILQTMPDEIATVVRLRFGLDTEIEMTPDDVADILDLDPILVADHLWAAETLFRHSSSKGDHRGHSPIGSREFQTFKWEGDLASYDLRNVNLNNVNLEHCDLSNAVLSGMNLWGAKLFRATLIGTSLWGAQVDNVDLQQTDLTSANFERASLCGANLRLANASKANFWGADFIGAQLEHANFHQADLRSANLAGLDLSATNFTGADLSGANLRDCTMNGTHLAGANLRGADLSNANLAFADLRNSDLCWANMSGVELHGASMHGAVQSPALKHMFVAKAPRPRRLRSVAG